ncbi:MAG: TonB-dependent receptor [Porticoccaceae bacterium]|nr:TonB-dependent receptor [Porticoccaceae bacterium]
MTYSTGVKSKSSILNLATAISIATASGLVSQAVHAQQRASSILEEVTVTAQKREQSADDVGIAITAFSADQMKALNFTNAGDVAIQSPNVEMRRHFVGRGLITNLFIRGVGSADLNNGSESPVAAFVDEFYLITNSTVDFSLFDMKSTEIIKGPQGTLFGRNATGGAFQFTTQEPEDEFGAYLEGTLGSRGTVQSEAMLNLPVTDKLKVRFSGLIDQHDPFVKNDYPGRNDIHESNFDAYRGQIKYQATDRWEILFKAESGQAEGNIPGDNLNPMMKQGDDIVFAPTNPLGTPKDADPLSVSHNSADWANNEVDHYLLKNVWEGDKVTFTSITGFMDQNLSITEDCDASADSLCNFHGAYESEHYTQEFRLNGDTEKFNWTLGAYYLNQDAAGLYRLNAFNGLLDPNVPNGGVLQYANYDIDVESYAVFGQIDYHLTETVTLIAGLRASQDKKSFSQENFQDFALVDDVDFDGVSDFFAPNIVSLQNLQSNIFNDSTAPDFTEIDEDGVSGTLQLNWQPNDDSLYYASFRRGLKAGGFNNGVVPLALSPESYPYEQEVLHAYELGAKLAFWDGRSRLNMATFYYDYQDYQASSFEDLGIFFENREAYILGAEVELFANPVEGLDIIVGSSFLETRVEDVVRAGTVMENEMGEAPHLTANAVIRYEWAVPTGYLSIQLDGNYVGQRYGDVLNQTAATLPSYSLYNTNMTYTREDEKLFARLWVKNLTDKLVPLYRIEVTDLGTGQDNFNDPRTAGITVGYHF